MKKPTVRHSTGKIERIRIVENFLPPPDRLVLREDGRVNRLTDEQVAEIRRRRAEQKAPKLTRDEFKRRLRRYLGE
jgi:hypothetical protein